MTDGLLCPVCMAPHRSDDVEIFTCQRCATTGWTVVRHQCSPPVYRVRTCGHVVDGARVTLHIERIYTEQASWRWPMSPDVTP